MPFLNTISPKDFQTRILEANRLERGVREKQAADQVRRERNFRIKFIASLLTAVLVGSFLLVVALTSIMPD